MAHRLFCISLATQFSDYSANLWGISASDSASIYVAWGGPPGFGPIDGTVAPCATAGSLPFLYSQSTDVLRWIRGNYPNAWQLYGYVDAFNPLTNWYDIDSLGIDLGISMLMTENERTQFVWSTFTTDSERHESGGFYVAEDSAPAWAKYHESLGELNELLRAGHVGPKIRTNQE